MTAPGKLRCKGTTGRTLKRLAPFFLSPVSVVSTCLWSSSSVGTQRCLGATRRQGQAAGRNHRRRYNRALDETRSDISMSSMRPGGQKRCKRTRIARNSYLLRMMLWQASRKLYNNERKWSGSFKTLEGICRQIDGDGKKEAKSKTQKWATTVRCQGQT